jgi:hypothetical protein
MKKNGNSKKKERGESRRANPFDFFFFFFFFACPTEKTKKDKTELIFFKRAKTAKFFFASAFHAIFPSKCIPFNLKRAIFVNPLVFGPFFFLIFYWMWTFLKIFL